MAESLAPNFLVAMDGVADPVFHRSVVLLMQNDQQEGSMGLCINRITDHPLASLCANMDLKWRGAKSARVGWGGPVGEETGWVLMGEAAADGTDAAPLLPGLYWSRKQEALRRMAAHPALPGRAYLGYTGWAPGQLEKELVAGAWLTVPAQTQLVFETAPEECWQHAIRLLGVEPEKLAPPPASATQGIN